MAKAKAKTTATKKFLVLLSGCGSFEQIGDEGQSEGPFGTEAEARKSASDMVEEYTENHDRPPGGVWIVQIIDSGKPSGVEWTGKAEDFSY